MENISLVESVPLCSCGCGGLVAWRKNKKRWNIYIYHHHRKGISLTEDHKRKISESGKLERHSQWSGGIINSQGYILIKNREHPFANINGYVKEERLVMEKYLGRYLLPEEVIHHVNSIRSDNFIDNLELFPDKKSHDSYHKSKGGPFKGRKHKDTTKQKMSDARRKNPQPRNSHGVFVSRGKVDDELSHLGCPAHPMCRLSPRGCLRRTPLADIDWYGQKG
jgi:hypothetical protein